MQASTMLCGICRAHGRKQAHEGCSLCWENWRREILATLRISLAEPAQENLTAFDIVTNKKGVERECHESAGMARQGGGGGCNGSSWTSGTKYSETPNRQVD